jgi:L-asparaginase
LNEGSLVAHKNYNPNIGVLKLYPGISESIVKNTLNHPETEAVILETFGSGNAPTSPWFLTAISEATARGLLILNITQCVGGSVELGRYETSKSLKDFGVLSGQDMTFEAAVTKLMFVLAQTEDATERKALITSNLRGEMTL